MRLFFDIESDNLLPDVSKIHCLCIVDIDSGQEWSFGPEAIEEGLKLLYEADVIAGHNVVRYDLKVLKKLLNWDPRPGTIVRDTLLLARLAQPNIKMTDAALVESGKLPKELHGSGSLEAWGYRCGIQKASYDGGWELWSQEMQDYCLQDCRTGVALWKFIGVDTLDPRSVELEHRVLAICDEITENGWPFDEKKAQDLYVELATKKQEIEDALVAKFGSWQEVDKVFIPKRDNRTLGYTKGVSVTKYKTVVFNPGSRVHIEKKLKELGWKPEEFTESGRAKLDEEILETIDLPEAKELIQYLLIQKRLGQLADGDNGWLKLVRDGKVHGDYNTMGTVTGRMSHHRPNMGQVPANGAIYGHECRSLFGVPKGWVQVGADQQALELRCLAGYLAHFDGGSYATEVISGDPHTKNQMAAELDSRAKAKTLLYGFLYGAGNEKIGKIVGRGPKAGKELKERLVKNTPGLSKLIGAVQSSANRGWLKGLDGRRIPVRSPHAALNSLLQSAGAVLCKQWIVLAYDKCIASGLQFGWDKDIVMLGIIHDETQVAVREGLEHKVGQILIDTAREAGEVFGFGCPLSGEYKVGSSWSSTH